MCRQSVSVELDMLKQSVALQAQVLEEIEDIKFNTARLTRSQLNNVDTHSPVTISRSFIQVTILLFLTKVARF